MALLWSKIWPILLLLGGFVVVVLFLQYVVYRFKGMQ
jgi:hypothetical protein